MSDLAFFPGVYLATNMLSKLRPGFTFALLVGTFFCGNAEGAPKIHTIVYGKWVSVQWVADVASGKKVDTIKVRPLIVDNRVKEYVTGSAHEVTDRLFVVRRVFRINDGLPNDPNLRWEWQPGGWLLIDRLSGRISPINLPEYDPFYSAASWYRDYIAYCGVSDDGKKTYAIVAQLSRRKPVLKKVLSEGLGEGAGPDSACSVPEWQRGPVRVSFEAGSSRQTFAIRGHVVDVVADAPEDDD